eukprot:1432203-Prymnesium_polylepis.1
MRRHARDWIQSFSQTTWHKVPLDEDALGRPLGAKPACPTPGTPARLASKWPGQCRDPYAWSVQLVVTTLPTL